MSTCVVPVQDSDSRSVQVSRAFSTVARTSLYPVPITMLGKITPDWELIRPLELSIERDSDGSYLASDDIFYMYGQGVTAIESVRDYLKVIVEYYQLLSADRDEPSAALFRYLQTYIQPVNR